MKVSREEGFKPVNITIESIEELEALWVKLNTPTSIADDSSRYGYTCRHPSISVLFDKIDDYLIESRNSKNDDYQG